MIKGENEREQIKLYRVIDFATLSVPQKIIVLLGKAHYLLSTLPVLIFYLALELFMYILSLIIP